MQLHQEMGRTPSRHQGQWFPTYLCQQEFDTEPSALLSPHQFPILEGHNTS